MLSFLNKKKQRQQLRPFLVKVGVVIALCIAQPFSWSFVKARAVELQDKRSQAQQIEEIEKRNEAISLNINEQKEFLRQLDVVVPPHSSMTTLIEKLEKLSDKAHVVVNIVGIDDTAAIDEGIAGGVAPVIVSMSAVGTLNQVFYYLEVVEHLQELSTVTSWVLSEATQSNAVVDPSLPAIAQPLPKYSLSFNIVFYLKRDGADAIK